MATNVGDDVLEAFGAAVERSTRMSRDDVRTRTNDLRHGRLRLPDSSSTVFRRDDSNMVGSAPLQRPSLSAASSHPNVAALLAQTPVVRAPITFPAHALRAAESPSVDEVNRRLTQLRDYFATQLAAGELPFVDLPDLHGANAVYDAAGNVFLGSNARRLMFDRRGGKTFVRLMLTMEAASNNLRNGLRSTKRGLYYFQRVHLDDPDGSQVETDRSITALAHLLGVRRRALGFVEARRGTVCGRLVVRDGEQILDLSKLGLGAYGIPRFTDDSEILDADADFILVVEKHSFAFRLMQARWWETGRCIIVCGEGCPSLSMREFVRMLVDRLQIPAIVCADADPGGLRVALTYAHGAISTALETPWLACNNVWWAGLLPSAIDRFCKASDKIPLAKDDLEDARRMLSHPSAAYLNDRVRSELALLVERGEKVELDAIANEPSRLLDDYLPKALFDSELVKI